MFVSKLALHTLHGWYRAMTSSGTKWKKDSQCFLKDVYHCPWVIAPPRDWPTPPPPPLCSRSAPSWMTLVVVLAIFACCHSSILDDLFHHPSWSRSCPSSCLSPHPAHHHSQANVREKNEIEILRPKRYLRRRLWVAGARPSGTPTKGAGRPNTQEEREKWRNFQRKKCVLDAFQNCPISPKVYLVIIKPDPIVPPKKRKTSKLWDLGQ